jgi:cyanophycinase
MVLALAVAELFHGRCPSLAQAQPPAPSVAASSVAATSVAAPSVAAIPVPLELEGTLLLCGDQQPSPAALEAFVELARGRAAQVVCVHVSRRDGAAQTPPDASGNAGLDASQDAVATAWLRRGGTRLLIARERAGAEASGALGEAIANATGLWLTAADPADLAEWLVQPAIDEACRSLRSKRGVIGGTGTLATAISESVALAPNAPSRPLWLPGIHISVPPPDGPAPFADSLQSRPACVGLRLERDTALLIRGRELQSLGSGQTSVVYAPLEGRRDPGQTLGGLQRVADLPALRRAALDRLANNYPPAMPPAPKVERGTLVIVGGGGTPPGLMQKFVEFAGGKEAVIAVLPISMPDPLPPKDGAAELFRKLGAKEVHVLAGRTPKAVETAAVWEVLDRATGLWFGGGRQWRFVDAYETTESLKKMYGVLQRGGVVGGSSAGATIQGDYLARGHPLGPHIMMADGYERAFSFLPGTAIDQHFTQRKRSDDMQRLMERYPQFLGLGIDETTALIVRGSVAEVVGKHHVHVFDTRRPTPDGRPGQVALPEGSKYDLVERRVLESPDTKPAP